MSEVFVVVVSYNGLTETQRTVQSLLTQVEPVRVLVWDNASTDGSAEWLASNAESLGIEHHLSETNEYWTPAINQAIEKYWDGEPYLVYMNNDVRLFPRCISRLRAALERNPKAGAVGPMGSSFGAQQDWGHFNGPADLLAPTPELLEDVIADREPKRVNLLIGAMVMLPKDVYDEVGPLDNEILLGGDDYDYSIRLQAAGYDLLVCQNVYVEHFGHASGATEEGAATWTRVGQLSWDAFGRKYPDGIDWDRAHQVAE